ncbi:MAG TPA: nucleotide pyrophosphohydrolase [Candidatus Saccharimonadales bacterium]|nr:nucleotide pyrophosphohydrolase [Candidatus Saccharimonadales bacterium]
MNDIGKLQKMVIKFRDDRDWKQFHNPKDLSISLVLEASELLEHFQWKNKQETDKHLKVSYDDIAGELADVFYWVLLIANDLRIDLDKALNKKIVENNAKYPIKKSKGNHSKYNNL